MDAPKCKICGERHRLGACPGPEIEHISGEEMKALLSRPRPCVGDVSETVLPSGKRSALVFLSAYERDEAASKNISDTEYAQRKLAQWRRGRRIAGEAHLTDAVQKPWEPLGMSRATYYRRKAAGLLP